MHGLQASTYMTCNLKSLLQISDVLNTCCNFDVYYYIILFCYFIGIYDYETFLDINGADRPMASMIELIRGVHIHEYTYRLYN